MFQYICEMQTLQQTDIEEQIKATFLFKFYTKNEDF